MAYNTIYSGSFNDILGDKIDIYIKQKDFNGNPSTLLLDGNPLVISYPSKEFDSQLFGCGAKINIINNSIDFFKYNSLFAIPERNNYVEIIKTSNNLDSSIYLFQGYILPEMYSSTLQKNGKITIPVTDQLSQLDRYKPLILQDLKATADTSAYRADEFINATDLMQTILYDIDGPTKMVVNNSLFTDKYIKGDFNTIFDNIFFDANQFSDSKGFLDSKKSLEMILKSFYSRCYYSNGKWMIERVKDIPIINKNMVVYDTDSSSVTGYINPNTFINLSDHNILNNSATVTYNPGYQKLIVNLKYKQPESLVDNIWSDWQYYIKEVSVNNSKPMPKLKSWMLSSTDVSLNAEQYSDKNLTDGIWFTLSSNWIPISWNDWTWLQGQYASSKFQFTTNSYPEKTVVNVKYGYSLDPGNITGTDTYKTNFALRAVDSTGKNWWIKANPDNNTTIWSETEYKWTKTIPYKDVSNNNYIEVTESIDITSPLATNSGLTKTTYKVKEQGGRILFWDWYYYKWVDNYTPTTINTQYINEIYLDLYTIQKKANWVGHAWEYQSIKTHLGNVDVEVAANTPPSILESSLNTYSGIKEIDLDIFDCSISQFTNGIFSKYSDNVFSTIGKWSDDPLESYKKIQYQYMEDLAQMYSKPRYTLVLDVKSKDSSLFTLGNIYYHNDIKQTDTSTIKFLCNGMDYNVKNNTYRMNLVEFKSDDGWRIDPSGYAPNFFINPSSLTQSWNGIGQYSFNVSTNIAWTADTSANWITLTKIGNVLNVGLSTNYGDFREASIYFHPVDMPITVGTVYQDVSTVGTIGWNDLGQLEVQGLGNMNVDVSIELYAYASVNSYYGNERNTQASVDLYDNGTPLGNAYVSVTTTTNDSDYQYGYYNYNGLTDQVSLWVTATLGNYQSDQDADCFPSIIAEITNVDVNGGGTCNVSFRRFEAYYNGVGEIQYVKS